MCVSPARLQGPTGQGLRLSRSQSVCCYDGERHASDPRRDHCTNEGTNKGGTKARDLGLSLPPSQDLPAPPGEMPVWGAHAVRRVLSTDPSSPVASPSAPHQTPSSHPRLSFMPLRPCPRCALPPRMLSFPLTRQTPLILYKDPAPMSTPCSALKGCPASFGRPGCASRGFAPVPLPRHYLEARLSRYSTDTGERLAKE